MGYDGVRIVTNSKDHNIRVWDAETTFVHSSVHQCEKLSNCIACHGFADSVSPYSKYGTKRLRIALICLAGNLAGNMFIAGGQGGSINSWSLTPMDSKTHVLSPGGGSGIAALNVEGSLVISGSR